ncbi:nucleoside-diphosphate kinase [Kitasatospora sp. CB02891]|nr:nucleoside-diphosphate kinase [Kitasatospora sp. CB02891]
MPPAWFGREVTGESAYANQNLCAADPRTAGDAPAPAVERTLVLLKPDTVTRGLVGRIIARFEDAGLRIVGAKMRWMDADLCRRHYFDLAERHGAEVYAMTARFMQQGPVIALALEGFDVVTTLRKMLGGAFPSEAAPGTIRGDFSHHSPSATAATGKGVANLVHASANRAEAEQEIQLWFDKGEMFDYPTAAGAFSR